MTVRAVGSLTLPAEITHLALELRAGTARAVLILDVNQSGKTQYLPKQVVLLLFILL